MITANYTVNEVAELAKVHPETVRRATRAGRLRAIRIGRTVRYTAKEVERWLSEGDPQTAKASGPAAATAKAPGKPAKTEASNTTYPWEKMRRGKR